MVKVNRHGVVKAKGTVYELASDAATILATVIVQDLKEEAGIPVRELVQMILTTTMDCFDEEWVKHEISEGIWLMAEPEEEDG